MELLEGESLREVILRRTPTTRHVLSWALQAAQGLSAAHQKGIVRHCLEKDPGNRFQSARDVAFALESLSQGTTAGTAPLDLYLVEGLR